MSDPNDVWQRDREGSPRRDDSERSPRRDRSRSPAAKSNGDGRGRTEEGQTSNAGNNLHVSGLQRHIDEAKLREFFAAIGKPVLKAQIMLDPHSQESRGFGFVMLESGEDAQLAIEKLNGQLLEGKPVTVAQAKRGRARTPTPGRYHGIKVDSAPRSYGDRGGGGYDRPYQPRSYDSRYADRGPPRYDDRDRRYDDRRYDDRRYEDRRYDDRRYRDERDRRDDHYSRDPRDGGERDRGGYDRREERPRYDDRPRYDEP
ncbi:uncharacterized protein L201_003699 [Kwoniella dendrophila CBS 6074]|uniref:RRM domain-containing protein n=1 Tax=Kwoniella dendrophila CBS 6074 TaxID=1295534 RepID=A0AAX4JTN1_9TREE